MWKGSILTSEYVAKSLKMANRSLFWEMCFSPVTSGSSFWDVFQVAKDLGFHCKDFRGKEFAFAVFNIFALNQKFAWMQLWAYKSHLRWSIHIQFQLNSESYYCSWVVKFKIFSLSYKGPDIFSVPSRTPLTLCAFVVSKLSMRSCLSALVHAMTSTHFPSPTPTRGWLRLLLNSFQSLIPLWNIFISFNHLSPLTLSLWSTQFSNSTLFQLILRILQILMHTWSANRHLSLLKSGSKKKPDYYSRNFCIYNQN